MEMNRKYKIGELAWNEFFGCVIRITGYCFDGRDVPAYEIEVVSRSSLTPAWAGEEDLSELTELQKVMYE
jgi:hypothetical protein